MGKNHFNTYILSVWLSVDLFFKYLNSIVEVPVIAHRCNEGSSWEVCSCREKICDSNKLITNKYGKSQIVDIMYVILDIDINIYIL